MPPSKAKLLHICESIQGGIAAYLEEIGPMQIADQGVENVRFVVPARSRSQLPNIPDECLILVEYDRRSVRSFCSYVRQLRKILANHPTAIIHAHSTFAGLATRLLRALRVSSAPIVYCAHGWSFLIEAPPAKRLIYTAVERALASVTDAIVNISQYEHQAALEAGIPAHKNYLIQNGIGFTSVQKPVQLPTSRINLLFSGRMDRQKGLDVLLEAMHLIHDRDIHLYIAGEAVLGRAARIEHKNVTCLGWLARDELDAYYAAADALVMPSRWEGFGLAAVEAMRQSTAVIASDRGALPEIVASGETGFIFRSGDSRALADVLRGLDKTTLRRWGAAGRERQRTLFSCDRVNSQLNEIYKALKPRNDSMCLRLGESRIDSPTQIEAAK